MSVILCQQLFVSVGHCSLMHYNYIPSVQFYEMCFLHGAAVMLKEKAKPVHVKKGTLVVLGETVIFITCVGLGLQ